MRGLKAVSRLGAMSGEVARADNVSGVSCLAVSGGDWNTPPKQTRPRGSPRAGANARRFLLSQFRGAANFLHSVALSSCGTTGLPGCRPAQGRSLQLWVLPHRIRQCVREPRRGERSAAKRGLRCAASETGTSAVGR